MLEPVSSFGKREELGVGAIAQAFVSHFLLEEGITLPPENARRNADSAVRKLHTIPKERAVPVDH